MDTTGAGDLFAAEFLFGLVRNAGYENAGRLGALAAAEVIQHIGARPQVSLKELAKKWAAGVSSDLFRRAGTDRVAITGIEKAT